MALLNFVTSWNSLFHCNAKMWDIIKELITLLTGMNYLSSLPIHDVKLRIIWTMRRFPELYGVVESSSAHLCWPNNKGRWHPAGSKHNSVRTNEQPVACRRLHGPFVRGRLPSNAAAPLVTTFPPWFITTCGTMPRLPWPPRALTRTTHNFRPQRLTIFRPKIK